MQIIYSLPFSQSCIHVYFLDRVQMLLKPVVAGAWLTRLMKLSSGREFYYRAQLFYLFLSVRPFVASVRSQWFAFRHLYIQFICYQYRPLQEIYYGRVHPSRPAHSLAVLVSLLSNRFNVATSTYTHSSVDRPGQTFRSSKINKVY